MPNIEVVAAVLTRDDGSVFVCRRSPGRASAGFWEFPGGKVERGEEPRDALARELREELDIESQIGALITRDTTAVGSAQIDLACYRVAFDSEGPKRSTDHDELRWMTPSELHLLRWAPPDLPAARIVSAGQPSP
ncbi:(deoxy)nucleoside triphosphate pyrophosphohydrolase [Curtobacterium sp. L3-7]|uniref:(deoxy)nucleoside triphosphate pyrophosphohydrolase n=1 Tax=Curtobacterium sp. L3-7 TaxID=3138787 RepID=UPI003B520A8A